MSEANQLDIASLRSLTADYQEQESLLREGGGPAGQERQRRLGRLTVRERLARLLDDASSFLELGIWAGFRMYPQCGEVPAAGVVTGIGFIHDRPCMIIANDATVKAGAFFPQTVKKVLRAQRIAAESALPVIYLVDSAGVFLPMQDEIFPDEDDFGRIFRNNAVLSAAGIPQYAAVMGYCIAGGAYLPVLCDKLLMTDGSGLYLAGPALVKAAIGQEVDAEELGGARMHAEISGTADFREPDDPACLARLRELIDLLPPVEQQSRASQEADTGSLETAPQPLPYGRGSAGRGSAATALPTAARDPQTLYDLVSVDGRREYDVRDLLAAVIDSESMQEYKAEYGRTLVTAYARIGGQPVGIVASQRLRCRSKKGIQIGGVIYPDSAEKAARFVMDCNQTRLPIVFFQDVVGFMVGREAEQSGIIRSGAKLVNVVSNSVVPKITVIVGNSFGAGNYALCGKAYDPRFIFAWPSAKYAVMGGDQASKTLFSLQKAAVERGGVNLGPAEMDQLREATQKSYQEQTDIRYGAARGWVDAIIAPHETRDVLLKVLPLVKRPSPCTSGHDRFHTGVLQV